MTDAKYDVGQKSFLCNVMANDAVGIPIENVALQQQPVASA
ncbi:MAG: hypothetical protein ACOH2O_02665 [Pseudomonas sp.]|jgi:hypothetical protein